MVAEVVYDQLDLSQSLNQEAFGALVGISQPAVSDMMSRGVIVAGAPCGVWLHAYCKHLREQAAGRGSDGELANERARLAREQADAQAMKNRIARREVAPVTVLEDVLAHVARQMATVLEALPPLLKRRFPDLTGEQIRMIETEVAKTRQLAASVSLSMLDHQTDDDEDS